MGVQLKFKSNQETVPCNGCKYSLGLQPQSADWVACTHPDQPRLPFVTAPAVTVRVPRKECALREDRVSFK